MKIEFKQAASGGSWSTLLDAGNGDSIESFIPERTQRNQNEALASNGNAGSAFNNYLGNTTVSHTLKGNRDYGTLALALAATRTVPASLQKLVHLRVTEGTEVHYYLNASLERCSPSLEGQSVTFTFMFRSNDATLTAPL